MIVRTNCLLRCTTLETGLIEYLMMGIITKCESFNQSFTLPHPAHQCNLMRTEHILRGCTHNIAIMYFYFSYRLGSYMVLTIWVEMYLITWDCRQGPISCP